MDENSNQEDIMARTGATKPSVPDVEPVIDFMAEAPPARPYGDAITAEHRALLAANGVNVAAASGE
jgi:hypothetical protein